MLSERKAMDAGKRPAFHDSHAAPLIQILAWLFLAFSTLAVVAQFATKKAMSRRLVAADFVLLAALVSIPGLRQDTDTDESLPRCCRRDKPRHFSVQLVRLLVTYKLALRQIRLMGPGR